MIQSCTSQKKVVFSLLSAALAFITIGHFSLVRAFTIPDFPSCNTPQGTTIANFSSGSHGIVGSASDHQGSDVVFQVSSTQVLQCFCAGNDGIQTNWLKADTISQSDQDFLLRSGWILIPNGALWGLDQAPYLAQNVSFSCGGTGGGGGNNNGGNGGGSSSNNSSSSNSGSSSSGVGGGNVLGATTVGQVLGLATTGTAQDSLLLVTSICFAAVGFVFIRNSRRV